MDRGTLYAEHTPLPPVAAEGGALAIDLFAHCPEVDISCVSDIPLPDGRVALRSISVVNDERVVHRVEAPVGILIRNRGAEPSDQLSYIDFKGRLTKLDPTEPYPTLVETWLGFVQQNCEKADMPFYDPRSTDVAGSGRHRSTERGPGLKERASRVMRALGRFFVRPMLTEEAPDYLAEATIAAGEPEIALVAPLPPVETITTPVISNAARTTVAPLPKRPVGGPVAIENAIGRLGETVNTPGQAAPNRKPSSLSAWDFPTAALAVALREQTPSGVADATVARPTSEAPTGHPHNLYEVALQCLGRALGHDALTIDDLTTHCHNDTAKMRQLMDETSDQLRREMRISDPHVAAHAAREYAALQVFWRNFAFEHPYAGTAN